MGAQSTNVSFALIMRNREVTGQGGFISAPPLLAIAPGPTVLARSSRASRWLGLCTVLWIFQPVSYHKRVPTALGNNAGGISTCGLRLLRQHWGSL